MNVKKRLLFQIVLILILYSPAFCAVDSISYPIYSYDAEGTRIATITKSQEVYFVGLYLSSQRDSVIKATQEAYILQLEQESSLKDSLLIQKDTLLSSQVFIMDSYKQELSLLRRKADKSELVIQNLNKIIISSDKKQKRRLLGWKIATGVTIGVFAIALPTTIAILSK